MTENLLQRGLELTVFGMGTVFIFLVMLIFATRGMSHFALKYGATTVKETSPKRATAAVQEPDQSELVAVIAAAIHQFRRSNKK